jgi:casein kinase 1
MKVNVRGVPKVFWFGEFNNGTSLYYALVMELLGPSLEHLYTMCGRKFSLKTITMLAIELLRRIEFQHSESYLHRDIKPDNFLMGLRKNAHIVYIIDLGLSKRFEDDNHKHVAYRENRKLIGTPRYTSINTHLGVEQTRRDDLESIAYMLFYFLRGKLPWQGLRAKTKEDKYQKILMKKMGTKVEDLANGHPQEFANLLKYAKELKFEQKPDYKMLRRWFYDLFRRSEWIDDCIFDWMVRKRNLEK